MNDTRPITITNTRKINKLKTLRVTARLSQAELSIKSGVPIKCIGNYEQGVRDLNRARVDIIYRLSEALNCSIYDLIDTEAILQFTIFQK